MFLQKNLIVFLIAAGFQYSTVCGQTASVDQAEAFLVDAEMELLDEIRRTFLRANVQYQMKHYAEASRLFEDCYALYLASVDYLSEPESLLPMVQSCERHMAHLERVRKLEAAAGGWQARLEALRFSEFRVHEAGFPETLEYFRQRIGRAMGVDPPDFVFAAHVPKLHVTLDVEDVNAIFVLETLASKAGWDVRFEKHAIVFSERAKVQ